MGHTLSRIFQWTCVWRPLPSSPFSVRAFPSLPRCICLLWAFLPSPAPHYASRHRNKALMSRRLLAHGFPHPASPWIHTRSTSASLNIPNLPAHTTLPSVRQAFSPSALPYLSSVLLYRIPPRLGSTAAHHTDSPVSGPRFVYFSPPTFFFLSLLASSRPLSDHAKSHHEPRLGPESIHTQWAVSTCNTWRVSRRLRYDGFELASPASPAH